MSQVFVRFCNKLAQLVLLMLICASYPVSAICQTSGPGVSSDPAEKTTTIPDVGSQTSSRKIPENKSNKSPFILTEFEPLLLLLFGSLLFAVATGIKLKLSRVKRASSKYFEPLVSASASRSETRS